jgi:XTP/dITP diphosphohydrolase
MGHGYDPFFVPKGQKMTFAEMKPVDKQKVSHRGLAMTQLLTLFKRK